jgi:hypothetical protein
MFLGLPYPDPLVRGMDPDPDLDSYCFVTSFGLFIFEKLCKCTSKSKKQKNFFLN